ncbi:Hsp20/alpha crystallin family protein [Natronospora cellulosivora (SeqCode)]
MFDLMPFNRRNRGLSKTRDTFEDFFNGFFDNFPSTFNGSMGQFKTDVKENGNEYIVQAELPGMNKENINIELNEDYLTIRAENNEVIEEEKDNYIRKERHTGRYQRSFYVKDINTDEINAKYDNGILELRLPKTTPQKNVKRIDIK